VPIGPAISNILSLLSHSADPLHCSCLFHSTCCSFQLPDLPVGWLSLTLKYGGESESLFKCSLMIWEVEIECLTVYERDSIDMTFLYYPRSIPTQGNQDMMGIEKYVLCLIAGSGSATHVLLIYLFLLRVFVFS